MMLNYPWNVSSQEAVEIQKKLREEVKLVPFTETIRFIGGADVSFNRFSNSIFADIVLSWQEPGTESIYVLYDTHNAAEGKIIII